MTKLGFLGAGNMGTAIIKGLYAANTDTEVFAFDKDTSRTAALAQYGVAAAADEEALIKTCDYILLAVKPQVLPAVLKKAGKCFDDSKVIISICAGVSEKAIRDMTYPQAKVILVMPNTPMMLGLGASAIARAENISDSQFEFAKSVISSCGIAVEVPIDKMKEIIAVNGSSPAFIYLFAKGFIDYADSVGIDKQSALLLFSQSLAGSAKMLTSSGMTADELIKQVSSPGGTTIAGLERLYEGDLTGDVRRCCEACTARAYELSE